MQLISVEFFGGNMQRCTHHMEDIRRPCNTSDPPSYMDTKDTPLQITAGPFMNIQMLRLPSPSWWRLWCTVGKVTYGFTWCVCGCLNTLTERMFCTWQERSDLFLVPAEGRDKYSSSKQFPTPLIYSTRTFPHAHLFSFICFFIITCFVEWMDAAGDKLSLAIWKGKDWSLNQL